MTRPYIVDLRDAAELPRELVGGKAKELGRLLNAGYRVPRGFVITTAGVAASTGDLPEEIRNILDHDAPRAVRSSAVLEDGLHRSFAGQYVSVLDVCGLDEALEALRTCCASSCSGTLHAYAPQAPDAGTLAVIVQDLVAADAAGVAFSRNPVTGTDEVLVEAVAGLGDRLLDGSVVPERWSITRRSAERTSGPGKVLTEVTARRVAETCRKIAEEHGTPQDVEWALRGDELYVLQARPITALPIEPMERPPSSQCWQRDDAHFSGPIFPLVATYWLPIHERSMREAVRRGGLPFDSVESAVYGGRVYTRVVPLTDSGRDDQPAPPPGLMWLVLRLMPAFRRRLRTAAEVARHDLPLRRIDEWESDGRPAHEARRVELLRFDRANASDEELIAHLREIIAETEALAVAHLELSITSGWSTFGRLGMLLEREANWTCSETMDLLQGYGDPALGDEAARLAQWIASDDTCAAALANDPALLHEIETPASSAFRAFFERYGNRVFSVDFDVPTWAEDPRPLYALLRTLADAPDVEVSPRERARRAEQRLLHDIADPELRAEADELIARARRARPLQDNTEHMLSDLFAIFRYAALEGAARLLRRGVLPTMRDAWFLEVEEFLDGLGGGRIEADIARRRGEFQWSRGHELPPLLGPEPMPAPTLPFPRACREYLQAIFWALAADSARPKQPVKDADHTGLPCSPGEATGPVRVIMSADELYRVQPGEILVCRGTNAAWSFVFPLIAGIVTEVGGPLSHPATLAREYGLPGVLSVPHATTQLRDGDHIRINGTTGGIWLERSDDVQRHEGKRK